MRGGNNANKYMDDLLVNLSVYIRAYVCIQVILVEHLHRSI